MGVTDVSAFPCCGKSSVDIVERTNDYYHTHGKAEEEEPELEAELPKQDPLPKAHPDPDLGPVPQLEEMEPVVSSAPTSKAKGDCVTESLEQQNYRLEPLKSYEKDRKEWSPTNRTWTLSTNSSKREEGQVSDKFRSIRVQTSKHLFWSNKLIQASEHSLQRALEKHKSSWEKKSVTIPQALTDSAPRPASPHMSCTSLPAAMGLADLINFASSLAVASSSNVETPNLENMIKVTSEKSQNTSLELCQPVQAIEFAQATQLTQISSEKPNKSPKDTSHNSWTQETRNVSYLDISKNGLKKATIQGEVKFVQASSTSPPFQGAKEDSMPRTKKGNPLLLKIHFKLSSPHPQRNN
ncbi:spermatogenesis-associated protein 32 [Psammomys obesus]|uniref:spermatogenesis-associated protein 32 n=1 Tax=Psammomys obesus TaxID=48139 RepID=UPI0024533280|nr:spermatogenesis-associated protein 32 [Psammomys obesus]